MSQPKVKFTSMSYHRNGSAGAGFHHILFDWDVPGERGFKPFAAVVFGDVGKRPEEVAVLGLGAMQAGESMPSYCGIDFWPIFERWIALRWNRAEGRYRTDKEMQDGIKAGDDFRALAAEKAWLAECEAA